MPGPALPLPNGWFRVAYSQELPSGKVLSLHYFGQELVLFRTADGIPHLFDAHCPHMGAHLGYGGCVEGTAIRYPFHGWLMDGTGRCIEVPYASKIPPKAHLRTWPVREVNGMILVYYHAQAQPPDWEIPPFPEYTSSAWTPFRPVHRWKIRTHAQEIAENGIDTGHMPFLHHQQTRSITSDALEVHGPVLIHRMSHVYNIFWATKWLGGAEVIGPLDITYYGLGCVVNRARVHAGIELGYFVMFLLTPIDAEYTEVHGVFSMQKVLNRAVTWLLSAKAIREGGKTIEQDIPIWENKVYRHDPMLCDGDGPIMQYRRWARQFYCEPVAGTTT